MLLGAEVFWNTLCNGQIKKSNDHPLLQKTLFGWILGGSLTNVPEIRSPSYCNLAVKATDCNLEKAVAKFWQIEQVADQPVSTPEEKLCEEQFMQTYTINESRFVVQLPIKQRVLQKLGNSYDIALKRFYALERKLNRNPALKEEYTQFINEYLELKHMYLVKLDDQEITPSYYLPHHAVVKTSSSTTKLRVVFDASCKSDTGVSLNDALMVGPTLQQDVFSILIKFRQWQYVITADIEKMFRQILVHKNHRKWQRILWRDDISSEVQVFELATLTYGTASAPFLAVRSLQEIARLEHEASPKGATRILNDFYVDDLVTGADTIEDIIIIRDQINAILKKVGFHLRKWASNQPSILEGLPGRSPDDVMLFNKEADNTTLGLQWSPNRDTFGFTIALARDPGRISKRTILSDTTRIFDPLGLMGPVIITAKVLLQRLWQMKVSWDETVPLDIHTTWSRYRSELFELNKLQVARKIICHQDYEQLELHSFCDASEKAYGASVYIRSLHPLHGRQGRLLCAKSRVAPLKNLSLPRLELCAALLAAQLVYKVRETVHLKFDHIYYWSDSMITLSWIKSEPRRWSTFVANRVSGIQELSSPDNWHHVESASNPADIISRGLSPALLLKSDLWWKGPAWFIEDSCVSTNFAYPEEIPEQRKTTFLVYNKQASLDLINKFSALNKLIRVTAYCWRFIDNCRKSENKYKGPLTVQETQAATHHLVKEVQAESFQEELQALRVGEQLSRSSKLLTLTLFCDEQGLLRVGGRLQCAKVPYDAKHQLILPSKHQFTKLLIQHVHAKLFHSGAQTTLAYIRQTYWPLNGRSSVRQVINKCIRCFRASPKGIQPIMGNLPQQRVQQSRPFTNVGVDFCGPFKLRESTRRNAKTIISYVAIFVCLAVKAIHIEVAFDLSSEGFINVLKRFIARRGKPTAIFSDNATNFVGANRELKEFLISLMKKDSQDKIFKTATEHGIQWHFIPPRAPNFGGLWEANVKSFKAHFKRVVGSSLLTIEEMQTYAVQIEAILNSRPLTTLSNDPNDLSYLSPGHFLIGDTLTAIPEPTLLDVKENRLSKWQKIERMKQHFWTRWSKDYLNQLQQRHKWKKQGTCVQTGDLVLVREDNVPPLCWPLGRIQEVHPGADGIVRTVTIKTAKGFFKRPTNRLSLLPKED